MSWAGFCKYFILFIVTLLVVACGKKEESATGEPIVAAPSEQNQCVVDVPADKKKYFETAQEIGLDFSKILRAPIEVGAKNEIKNLVEVARDKIPDADFRCLVFARLVACAINNNNIEMVREIKVLVTPMCPALISKPPPEPPKPPPPSSEDEPNTDDKTPEPEVQKEPSTPDTCTKYKAAVQTLYSRIFAGLSRESDRQSPPDNKLQKWVETWEKYDSVKKVAKEMITDENYAPPIVRSSLVGTKHDHPNEPQPVTAYGWMANSLYQSLVTRNASEEERQSFVQFMPNECKLTSTSGTCADDFIRYASQLIDSDLFTQNKDIQKLAFNAREC